MDCLVKKESVVWTNLQAHGIDFELDKAYEKIPRVEEKTLPRYILS